MSGELFSHMAYIRSEYGKFARLVKDAGIKDTAGPGGS